MDRRRDETAFDKIIGQTLRSPLGSAEDHDPVAILGLQDACHDLRLVQVMNLVDELRRGGNGRGIALGLGTNIDRMAHMAPSQRHDRSRHRRREQHGLTQFGRS